MSYDSTGCMWYRDGKCGCRIEIGVVCKPFRKRYPCPDYYDQVNNTYNQPFIKDIDQPENQSYIQSDNQLDDLSED